MAQWYSISTRRGNCVSWRVLRGSLVIALLAQLSGCSWLWPQPDPEREAVQYSYATLPSQRTAPKKTAHDRVTILPKKDGSIGGVVIRQDGVAVLLDKAYATALVEGPGMITQSTYDAQRAQEDFALVLAALPGEPANFLLYFLEATDELTPESEAEIDNIFAELAARPAPEILVIGHADAVGTAQYNDKLSLQRAEHVRDELIRRGVAEVNITVEGRGKREPLVTTEDGISEPKNRRVEISVR